MQWDVRRFDTIDSTNTWLLARARDGDPEGLVAVADHQTAGRGRLGRTWEAPPRSALLCSVLLRPARLSHLVTASVALAARDACGQYGRTDVDLKWPNDLMVGGAKLAGVLAEVDAGAVVVGIGLNLSAAPDGAAMLGESVDRDDFLARFLDSLASWHSRDSLDVARAYRKACATIGRAVRVELVDETFTGTAADIDDDGHLLVDVGACIRTIAAADVIHLR